MKQIRDRYDTVNDTVNDTINETINVTKGRT